MDACATAHAEPWWGLLVAGGWVVVVEYHCGIMGECVGYHITVVNATSTSSYITPKSRKTSV